MRYRMPPLTVLRNPSHDDAEYMELASSLLSKARGPSQGKLEARALVTLFPVIPMPSVDHVVICHCALRRSTGCELRFRETHAGCKLCIFSEHQLLDHEPCGEHALMHIQAKSQRQRGWQARPGCKQYTDICTHTLKQRPEAHEGHDDTGNSTETETTPCAPWQSERAASAPALQPPQRMPAIHMLEQIRHQSCVICAMLAPYTPPSTPCASLCRRLPPGERILGWLGSKVDKTG